MYYVKNVLEANSSVVTPDERDIVPPHTSLPAIHVMETSFDEEDYPTEVHIPIYK